MRFAVDSETHDPIDVKAKELLDTNSLVEEFMLFANITVAKKIYDEFGEVAVLRRHPAPPISNYDPLLRAARSRGIDLAVESGGALADSLDRVRKPSATSKSYHPYAQTLLRMMTTRCMMQALYFCSGSIR